MSFEEMVWQHTAFPHSTFWIACGYSTHFGAFLNLEKNFHL